MINGTYSDYQSITLADGRSGVIMRSLGHQFLSGRRPDETRGPCYEVLINGHQLMRDSRIEWHGDGYVTIEETADHHLQEITLA